MNCEFCNNSFSSKHILVKHQKNTKYCLKLQQKEYVSSHKCEGCQKTFTTIYDLNIHIKKCKASEHFYTLQKEIETLENTNKELTLKMSEQEKIILEQKNTIKELQNTIEKLATHAISRPTISTTKNTQINYIQQMKPVIDDELKDNAQNLTIDHILKGPEGYAQYALEYPLKDRVCCVDYARRKVKFKDPNGNVITDPEMSTLATKFFQSIKDKNKDLIIEYGTKLNEHLGEHLQDLIDILDIKSGVDNGADGSKTEFYHDFVKNICGKTIIE